MDNEHYRVTYSDAIVKNMSYEELQKYVEDLDYNYNLSQKYREKDQNEIMELRERLRKTLTVKEMTDYVKSKLDDRTLWEQLAEECSELGKAALKFIRAAGLSNNPTPVSKKDAYANAKEELHDVLHVCSLLGLIDDVEVDEEKLKRWVKRISENEDNRE